MSAIGSGAFGTVFKVKHKLVDKIYAVKRIQINESKKLIKDKVLNEAINLAKLDSDFVVNYYHSWIEEKYLYIQMEYCSQTLGSVIKDKDIIFDKKLLKAMDIYEYFISCEIFREILQCLQYLHSRTPPIIHRDIKPENILVLQNIKNDTFLKLGDFGLATEHHDQSQSHTQGAGTLKYMAPDVGFNKKYDFKADIYSAGVIGLKLFEINTM
ncbi:unnamed protein product, partial [Medioppia subpectinata]